MGSSFEEVKMSVLADLEKPKSDTGIIKCPEGIEIDLIMYLVSPSTGHEARLRLGGFPAITSFDGQVTAQELAEKYYLHHMADDWRMMTRAEIKEYKVTQSEDEEG